MPKVPLAAVDTVWRYNMPEHILKEHGKRRGVFNLPLLCLLNVLVLLCNRFTYPLVLRSLDRLVCFDTCFASVLVFAYVFFH